VTDGFGIRRRRLLAAGLGGLVVLPFGSMAVEPGEAAAGLDPPDLNGVRHLPGFRSRVIARSGERPVAGGDYIWHAAPDGAACFATTDGGWIYVSNSELPNGQGGVGALRFDTTGRPVAAYPLLTGTHRNCAGGATPWGSWLSCEEVGHGRVWECDPFGLVPAVVLPALGRFAHEGAAVDPASGAIYLTEDVSDGCLYRFVPAAYRSGHRPDLGAGVLEVAERQPGSPSTLRWHRVPDPQAGTTPTRHQVPRATRFHRGEGIVYHGGVIYFTTTGEDRVWAYHPADRRLEVVYDAARHAVPPLRGIDNLAVTPWGELLVAEDGAGLRLARLRFDGRVMPLLQLVGHDRSEVAGPAFSPDGRRLYFSSQRGTSGRPEDGVTFEITGPFPV